MLINVTIRVVNTTPFIKITGTITISWWPMIRVRQWVMGLLCAYNPAG